VTGNSGIEWRVGDVVAFEQMRQLSDLVVARVVLSDPTRALAERRRTLLTNGYDRAAVDARSRELAELLREVLG
jgi:hypothetical protein